MNSPVTANNESVEAQVGRIADEFTQRLNRGEYPSIEEYAERFPEIARLLREVLPALQLIRLPCVESAVVAGSAPAPEAVSATPLGDYRLLREVGRGGMGVVYEAEQLSLNRRVALKVLPFAAALDEKQLQRFRNEAQAAAQLHHTNIVPVYGVGCERGVHFYAMQFIEGKTLAALIDELNQTGETLTGRMDAKSALPDAAPTGPYVPAGTTPALAKRSTERSSGNPAFIRTAASLAVQAADALEHAHEMGIVHRDIKPANLMVDGRGNLWITDFGLAQVPGDGRLTMSGDLLGTLRYMSPEQALAKRVPLDHRTDIYSLGVTLYELLSLQPAFPERDRQELLRQIAFEEPRPPRQLNRAIPWELETIVLKAIAKNPSERYAEAKALADDLRRFLEDKPIQARRPTLAQRARKWGRRHPAVVWAAVIVTLVLFASLAAVSYVRQQAALDQAESQKRARAELELNLYSQTIGRADGELATGNVGRAEELLNSCNAELRGWEWHYLKRRRFGPGASARPGRSLFSLTVSPNGTSLAVGGHDGTIRIWNIKDWTETGSLAHGGNVRGVAFSPDRRRLASAGEDGRVRLWDLETGHVIYNLPHTEEALCVAFSPDGRLLLSGDDEGAFVWDAATGELLKALPGRTHRVLGVAFSPDGRLAATADENDRVVRIWNTSTWTVKHRLGPHIAGLVSVAFHPDSKRLAAAGGNFFMNGDDGELTVWDVEKGEAIHTLIGHQGIVLGLAFSPDGTRLASTGGEDATIKVWNVATGLETLTLRGHEDSVWAAAFSSDGNRLFSTGADHTLRVWDGTPLDEDSGGSLRTFVGHAARVTSVSFHRDGHRLASAGIDRSVRVWDVTTGRQLQELSGGGGPVNGIVFSPAGDVLVSVCTPDQDAHKPSLKVWDCRTWRERRVLALNFDYFVGATFSPNTRRFAAAGGGSIAVLDTLDFSLCPIAYNQGSVLTSISISRDSRYAATADVNGEVWFWDLDDRRPVLAALSSTPLLSGLINLHDSLNARPVHRLPAHATRVTGASFSPTEDILATCGMNGATRLWDTKTYKMLDELRGHAGGVRCLAFNPEGSRLATGGNDATIRVWDVATRRELFVLRGHTDTVYCVTFNRDGRYIASGSLDKTVKVWDAQPALAAKDGGFEDIKVAETKQAERRRSRFGLPAAPGGRR
jgi:WD40 repeat protein/serine/threonine protein kinase